MTDQLRANANLVDSLSSAARHGGSALADAPILLRRVLESEAWREFVTQRGDHVKPRSFREFVTSQPLRGLGVEMDLVERIVAPDVDLRELVRDAERVGHGVGGGRGHKLDGESPSSLGDDQTGVTAARLAREHPEAYAKVRDRELSVNAAAVLAGIRPRRVSVRLDRAESVAKTLRSHMEPEALAELARLLRDDEDS